LLDVSRITQGKIELERAAVPVDEMLEGALESVRPALEAKRQSATVIGTNDSFFVTGDSARLNQIFVNLFVNASKYSPQDTKIIITIERQDSTALIRIKDEGIGIDAVTLPHIFELFVQADHSLDHRSGGLGIGLTIVKTLVEMHGGRVEVRSAGLGHGTEFTVHLPLASAP